MNWSTIADSALATIQSAVTGAGPGVVGVAAVIIAVGLVISLIKKAK